MHGRHKAIKNVNQWHVKTQIFNANRTPKISLND